MGEEASAKLPQLSASLHLLVAASVKAVASTLPDEIRKKPNQNAALLEAAVAAASDLQTERLRASVSSSLKDNEAQEDLAGGGLPTDSEKEAFEAEAILPSERHSHAARATLTEAMEILFSLSEKKASPCGC